MEKTAVCASFGRAAEVYDSLALFQRKTNEQMLCRLPEQLPPGFDPARILDAGCGTGFGAQCLKNFWPDAELTGCDISDAMTARMKAKGFNAVTGDLEALPFPDKSFDFAWSCLALQWCRPEKAFPEIFRVLKSGGAVYFSTLLPGTLSEVSFAFAGIDSTRRVLEFRTEEIVSQALSAAGFEGIELFHEKEVMHYPDVRSALQSIRGIGAGSIEGKRRAMMGKNAWKTVQARYESLRNENGIPVTYELLTGFGIKP